MDRPVEGQEQDQEVVQVLEERDSGDRPGKKKRRLLPGVLRERSLVQVHETHETVCISCWKSHVWEENEGENYNRGQSFCWIEKERTQVFRGPCQGARREAQNRAEKESYSQESVWPGLSQRSSSHLTRGPYHVPLHPWWLLQGHEDAKVRWTERLEPAQAPPGHNYTSHDHHLSGHKNRRWPVSTTNRRFRESKRGLGSIRLSDCDEWKPPWTHKLIRETYWGIKDISGCKQDV